jgi:hypothetical protein
MALINSSDIAEENKTIIAKKVHDLLDRAEERPFMTHTADEILYKGWSLIKLVELIFTLIQAANPNVTLPPLPDDVVFGLLSTV